MGTDQTSTLVKAAQGAEAKADVYAAHLPDSKGAEVVAAAEAAAGKARELSRRASAGEEAFAGSRGR